MFGLMSGISANRGVKPKGYFVYFEAEQRRAAEIPPSGQARGDVKQALRDDRPAAQFQGLCRNMDSRKTAPVSGT
jgi:hypothetical protein